MDVVTPILTNPDPAYVPGPEIPYRDTSVLIVDDGAPVESIFAEKQQRLLCETLYNAWSASDGKPFLAMANVGLFHAN